MNLNELTWEIVEKDITILFRTLAKTNNHSFNLTKLAEELAELSEVVLKMNNKNQEKQPNKQLFIEETGDILIRALIAGFMLFPEEDKLLDKLSARVEFKIKKMIEIIKAGKYLNQV